MKSVPALWVIFKRELCKSFHVIIVLRFCFEHFLIDDRLYFLQSDYKYAYVFKKKNII